MSLYAGFYCSIFCAYVVELLVFCEAIMVGFLILSVLFATLLIAAIVYVFVLMF